MTNKRTYTRYLEILSALLRIKWNKLRKRPYHNLLLRGIRNQTPTVAHNASPIRVVILLIRSRIFIIQLKRLGVLLLLHQVLVRFRRLVRLPAGLRLDDSPSLLPRFNAHNGHSLAVQNPHWNNPPWFPSGVLQSGRFDAFHYKLVLLSVLEDLGGREYFLKKGLRGRRGGMLGFCQQGEAGGRRASSFLLVASGTHCFFTGWEDVGHETRVLEARLATWGWVRAEQGIRFLWGVGVGKPHRALKGPVRPYCVRGQCGLLLLLQAFEDLIN